MSYSDLKLDLSERLAKMTSRIAIQITPWNGEVPKNSYSYDVKCCRWFALKTPA